MMTEANRPIFLKDPAESNRTAADYPKIALHTLIEQTVVRYGDKQAVRDGLHCFSYREMNEQANRLSHWLTAQGVRPGDMIGLLTDRSALVPVILLAILKAGAAYIPLDPDYPGDRIRYMLENAGAGYLFTQKKYTGKTGVAIPELIAETAFAGLNSFPDENPANTIDANALAYILYTSGSTGKPKGVMVEHRSVVNLLWHLHTISILTDADRLLAITTVSFDIAVLELFLPLVAGALLVITDSKVSRDGSALLEMIQKEEISIMQATPVTWKIMLAAGWEQQLPVKVLCCGEALPLDLAKKIIARCHKLYNYYGPTETTIYSTGIQVFASDTFITIGKPVANTQVYIFDEEGKELAAGEGELYIGGDGVSRGYINQPELTAERFLDTDHGRIFRTGDIGQWTDKGDIQLFGRADHQIKLRGFRIEPGEIETCLRASPAIKDAVVIAREDTPGHKMLVAYLVPDQGKSIDLSLLKKSLQQAIPEYMVPHEYMVLDALPLTLNGKIDRKALPKPGYVHNQQSGQEIMHAVTPTEKMVEHIWQEALERDEIDINENFFDIGGHSLIAVEMMCRLEEATGKRLPIATLFEAPTIRSLSQFIDTGDLSAAWQSIIPIKPNGSKPPLYIIHGDGLNVMVFHSMVKHLEDDQPVFGLQPRGMDGVDMPDESIEEMAAYYISVITKENPKGPYLLAGYSFGGIVGVEMARQLQEAGRQVKLVALFDTNVGNIDYTGSFTTRLWKRIRLQVPKIIFILRTLIEYPGSMLAYQRLVVKRKWNNLLSRIGLGERIETEQLSEEQKKVFEKNERAIQKYQLTPYPGKIDLFRVSKRIYFVIDPKYLGWKNLAQKGLFIHPVPGDHHTFLLPPNDKVFANKLQSTINERLNEKV